jgi:hypothetical protein
MLSLSTGGRRGGKLVQITEKKKDFNANRGEEPHTRLYNQFVVHEHKKLSQHTEKKNDYLPMFSRLTRSHSYFIFFWLYLKIFFVAQKKEEKRWKIVKTSEWKKMHARVSTS